MTFLPGKIRTSLSKMAYHTRMDENFHGNHKDCKVECNMCGEMLAVGALASHMASEHNFYQPFVLKGWDEAGLPPPPRRWGAVFHPVKGVNWVVIATMCQTDRKGEKAAGCGTPGTCGGTSPTAV